jgi:hypothetical protein
MAAKNKTTENKSSVSAFLGKVTDPQRRADCKEIAALMQAASGEKPAMWGTSIVGFGSYHYKYASGREGDMPLIGFSPRKQNLTLYIMGGFENYAALLKQLGTYTTGVGCLYIKQLADVHKPTLSKLMRASVKAMRAKE